MSAKSYFKPIIASFLFFILLGCDFRKSFSDSVFPENPFDYYGPEIRIAAVGDIMFSRGVQAHIDTAGYSAPLRNLASFLNSFDITTGNLECPVSNLGEPIDKKYVFRANPLVLPELHRAGFDVLCFANNHVFDYGLPCFLNSITKLSDYGFKPVGCGKDLNDAMKPAFIYKGNTVFGFLAFNDTKTNFIGANRPATAPALDSLVFISIKETAKRCDVLIVHIHWGEEYFPYPTDRQVSLGRAMIDSGATIILGHHPHRWEGIEFYKNGLIAYSLGNFIFDQRDLTNNLSGILELTFIGNKLKSVAVSPIELLSKPREPKFANGEHFQVFEAILRESCLRFPVEIVEANGKLELFDYDSF